MARIRSVKPGYFTSLDTAGQLSIPTRLHFIGLWTYADDHGRGVDDPRLIKSAVWPLDDNVKAEDVERFQDELERAGRIVRYVDSRDGRRYFEVTSWGDHQKPNRPQESKYPSPCSDHAVSTHDTVSEGAVKAHADPGGDGLLERRGGEGRGTPLVGTADAVSDDEGFEAFWDAYPRHHDSKLKGGGGDKQEARRKWRKLKPADRDEVMRALGPYASLCAPGGQIPKHAVRFLTGERWQTYLDMPDPTDDDEFVGGVRRVR